MSARSRLIDAMIEVSAREGYATTSVADVIAAAGASRSTFYEHFADRDDCFVAALGDVVERVEHQVQSAIDEPVAATEEATTATEEATKSRPSATNATRGPAQAPAEPATATLGALMRFTAGEGAAARVLLLESLAAGPAGLALRDGLIDTLAEAIERGWAARPDELEAVDAPALGLIGGLFRLLSMRLPTGDAALSGLGEELEAWFASYTRATGPFAWRSSTALGRIDTLAAQAAPEVPPLQTLPRGRHGLAAAEVARSQRERILAAVAYESFEHGYANVTVTGIVAAASISRNVFYEQFSDKQEAAIAALQDGFERAMTATAQSFFAGGTWPERIWAMAERLTEHYLAHPSDAYLSFVELHAIGPEAVRLAHERLRAFTLLLEEGYTLRASSSSALPRLVSEALVAAVLELGYRQAPRQGARKRHVLLGQQAYLCLAPFIGVDAASELVAERLAGVGTS